MTRSATVQPRPTRTRTRNPRTPHPLQVREFAPFRKIFPAKTATWRGFAAVVVVLLAAVVGAVGGSARSGAVSPSRQGWWKVGLPVADVGVGGVGNLSDPQGADVPGGGLLVQGGPSAAQPAAYAALVFDLGTAAVAGPLKLVLAPNTASLPGSKLIACPLTNASFAPAAGGSMSDAPAYSCGSAVAATVDSSGAYVFDVAGLQRGDALAVAILPTAPTDRVVFAKPGDGALPVNESSGAAADAAAAPPSPDVGAAGSAADTAAPLSSDIGIVGAPFAAPSSVSPAPVASAPPGSLALPAAQPAIATHSSSSSSYGAYVIAVLLALAGVLWVGAGTATAEPT